MEAGRTRQAVDYRKLAGMASKDRKAGSKRSAASIKSKKSKQMNTDTTELDQELEKLQEKIDNNPAYVAESYEKAQRRLGTEFITEGEIGEDITDEQAKELLEAQDKDMADMDRRIMQLEERQRLINKKSELAKKRRKIELMLWKQKDTGKRNRNAKVTKKYWR